MGRGWQKRAKPVQSACSYAAVSPRASGARSDFHTRGTARWAHPLPGSHLSLALFLHAFAWPHRCSAYELELECPLG